MVCTCRWRGESSEALVPLQLACSINTDVPGSYRLRYRVTNSAGLTAVVTRQLVVIVECQPGERRCDDEVRQDAGGFVMCRACHGLMCVVATPAYAHCCV